MAVQPAALRRVGRFGNPYHSVGIYRRDISFGELGKGLSGIWLKRCFVLYKDIGDLGIID
jgi:hypothetical protein